MTIAKRLGWVLVDMLIGAVITTSVHARQGRNREPDRLIEIANNVVAGRSATLIKDAKGDGCWLMISGNEGMALARAPAAACYQH